MIGWALGWAAITPFKFANQLVDLARMLLRSTTVTLTPAISASEARGDLRPVRDYFLHGTRLVLYAALPIQAGLLILLGKPFLAIWLPGPNVAEPAGPTLWVLAATLSLTIAQSVASRVLYGMGRIRLVCPHGTGGRRVEPAPQPGAGSAARHRRRRLGDRDSARRLLPLRDRARHADCSASGRLIICAAVGLAGGFDGLAGGDLASPNVVGRPDDWGEFFFVGLFGMVPYAASCGDRRPAVDDAAWRDVRGMLVSRLPLTTPPGKSFRNRPPSPAAGLTRRIRLIATALSANSGNCSSFDAQVAQPPRDADVGLQPLDGRDGPLGRRRLAKPADVLAEQFRDPGELRRRAGRLKRMTCGSSRPLPSPCEQFVAPPTGYSSAWTSATPTLENASPASVAASAMPSRASRSSPCRTARRRCCRTSRIAFSAHMSPIGCRPW